MSLKQFLIRMASDLARAVDGPKMLKADGASAFEPDQVGRPILRVDGRAKVTGTAAFTAERTCEGLVYGVAIGSAVPHGRVTSVDAGAAERTPGFVAVVTPETMPKLKPIPDVVQDKRMSGEGGLIEMLLPMQDDRVHYAGQIVALVVAETLEQAIHAARLVHVRYEEETPELDAETASRRARPKDFAAIFPLQLSTGDVDEAYEAAAVRMERTYETPPHYHCPIELPCTIASWERREEGDFLTMWDTTRLIKSAIQVYAHCLDMPEDRIALISKFVGGAFGSKAWFFGNPLLVAVGARQIGRPLKVEWSRAQTYEVNGYRPETRQTIRIGADRDGHIASLRHDGMTPTSAVSGYPEPFNSMTMVTYGVPNLAVGLEIRHLNLPTPTPMRGVGGLAGGWALETALDELAHEVGIDPVDLRLMHDTDKAPLTGIPFSARRLEECFRRGKALIGWERRTPLGTATTHGRQKVGLGVASSTLGAIVDKASARATLSADGTLEVSSATHEIGNGAYTIFTQIAADAAALPLERVRFILGDSRLPDSPVTAGSRTTANVGAAVLDAGRRLLAKLKTLTVETPSSPLHGKKVDEIEAAAGRLFLRSDPGTGADYDEIVRAAGCERVEADGHVQPSKLPKYELHSFGALFAEVRVDVDTGVVRVNRVVGVFDVGRLINPRTAYSQLVGGIIAGLGGALTEEGYFHPTNGRPVNRNLADYHVPSHADAPEIMIDVLNIPDPAMGELGGRGIGEMSVNNVPAAVGNAVFNATGRRLRKLPLTPDRVLEALT